MNGLFHLAATALLVCVSPAFADIAPALVPSAVSSGLAIDWAAAGLEDALIATPFSVPMSSSVTASIALASPASVRRVNEGSSWTGNFSLGTRLLFTNGNPGPLSLSFSRPIQAFGLRLQPNFGGGFPAPTFTATLRAFNSRGDLLGSVSRVGPSTLAEDGSALFAGMISTATDISLVQISVADEFDSPFDFACDGPVGAESIRTTTVTTTPAGLPVTVDGASYVSPQTFSFLPGSTHSIATVPAQGSGDTRFAFTAWSDGGGISHNVTEPSASTTYAAAFATQYLLTTSVSPGSGGVISVNPLSSAGYYAAGAMVQLAANPSAGFAFSEWSGGLSGSINPQSLVMTGPNSVVAAFTALSACVYSIGRLSASVAGTGDLGEVDVSTTPECEWTAAADTNWITIRSGSSGRGPGTVRYSIAGSNASRSATITVAGQAFQVFQAASTCSFSVIPQSIVTGFSASTFSVAVATAPACLWTPAAAPGWISLPSGARGGSGAIVFSLASNPGPPPRTGSISVASQTAQLLQASPNPVPVFQDVPVTHPYFDYTWLMKTNAITSGCTVTAYCPDNPTTRGQMAVFLIRSLLGGDTFPYTATPFFADVPASHPYFSHIQKMRELGITAGCTATTYCPDDPVTRGQMAVFLIRGRLGVASGQAFPSPTAPYFTDAPAEHPFFSFIQKMKELGITSGCSATQYCADALATRGQMAVFLVRTFFTP